MTQFATSAPPPRPPSLISAASVFALVGPAAGPFLFALFLAIAGLWNIGPASLVVGAGYFIWFLPFFYVPLAVPFGLTGIAYARAARRLARPSLLVALIAGAVVFVGCIALLYFAGWLTAVAGYELRNTDEDIYALPTAFSNLGVLTGVMAIGVVPSWWLTRDRSTRTMWI